MRVATFNIENPDETRSPALAERIPILRPGLLRLNAGILCLQRSTAKNTTASPAAYEPCRH